MTLKSDAKFEEKLTLGSKNNMRNLVNFNASSGKSENLHIDVYIIVEPKKYRGVMGHNTEEDAKFEEEPTLKNDLRNLANFDPTLESLKICTLMGCFCPEYTFEIKKVQKSYASLY